MVDLLVVDIDPDLPAPEQEDGAPTNTTLPTVLTKLQKWGDYPSWGEPLHNTRFIPMKTPLSAEILASWSLPKAPLHSLTVGQLVAAQGAQGRRVGLLLDLSNHDCLYTSDIPEGVAYAHIHLVAKELPPPSFVDEVCRTAQHFWAQHPEDFIAVHCAYGFNRTGFVMACYLVQVCGLSVDEALDAFKASRPPGVKHDTFRQELFRRYATTSTPPQPRYSLADSGLLQAPDGSAAGLTVWSPGHHPLSDTPRQGGDVEEAAAVAAAAATSASLTSVPGTLAAVVAGGGVGIEQEGGGGVAVSSAGGGAQGGVGLVDWQDHTPQGCGLGQQTENDSLGANDRCIMQELRAQYLLTSGQLSALQLEGLLAATTPPGLQPAQGPGPGSRTPGGRSPGRSSLPVPDRSLGAIKWQTEAVQAQHDAELDLVVKTMEEA
ncbi:protein-tyrosine phosphatase-like protein [Haematococcus lacustris]